MHLKHHHINSVEKAQREAEEGATHSPARATVKKRRAPAETRHGGGDTSDSLLLHATSHESDSEEWVEESRGIARVEESRASAVCEAADYSWQHDEWCDEELSCDDQSSDEGDSCDEDVSHSSHHHVSHVPCSSDADSGTDTTDTSGSESGVCLDSESGVCLDTTQSPLSPLSSISSLSSLVSASLSSLVSASHFFVCAHVCLYVYVYVYV